MTLEEIIENDWLVCYKNEFEIEYILKLYYDYLKNTAQVTVDLCWCFLANFAKNIVRGMRTPFFIKFSVNDGSFDIFDKSRIGGKRWVYACKISEKNDNIDPRVLLDFLGL